MKLLRRLIAWSFFAGLLTAVGAGVFVFVRYRPRCTVADDAAISHLSADGRWLVTHASASASLSKLQVWDLRSGSLARSIPVSGRGVMSPDKSQYAFRHRDQPIQIAIWQTGETWTIPVPGRAGTLFSQYSPRGKWLWIKARDPWQWLRRWVPNQTTEDCIIDLANRKIAWRCAHKFLGFTNDDRHVVCQTPDATFTVHDAATGREVALVKSDTHPAAPTVCLQSPNGQWLVTLVTSGRDDQESTYPGDVGLNRKEFAASVNESERDRASFHIGRLPICGFEVWSVADGRKLWRVERPERDRRAFCFSPNSRWFATWYAHHGDRGTYEAEFFDFKTGKRIAVMPLKAYGEGCFSADGEFFLYRDDEHNSIALFDVAEGRVLWERSCSDVGEGQYNDWFVGDSHRVHYPSANPRRLEVLNPETGEPEMILPDDFPWGKKKLGQRFIAFAGKWERPKLLPELPWLTNWWHRVIGQREIALVVADPVTGQEQIRLLRSSIFDFSISEDGQTVVTVEPRTTATAGDESRDILVWDVKPGRAWFWAVTASIITGCAMFLLRRWRQKRKAPA